MRYFLTLLGIGFLFNISPAYTQEQSNHVHHQTSINTSSSNSKIFLESVPSKLTVFKPTMVRFQLIKDGKVLTLNSLKEEHTKKLHVMVIDASLKDFHHIHPIEDKKNKDFVFEFIPKYNGPYQMWVDITPTQTNKQELLVTNLGTLSKVPEVKGKEIVTTKRIPYEFHLKMKPKPKVGMESMVFITVTNNQQPFTRLEPVKGSFAHLVGFGGDHSSMLHIHSLGKKPSKKSDRGGPTLAFHVAFKKSGFVKLFAQLRIKGQDFFVPFGIIVKS